MPRTCSICRHPNLPEIDASLIAGKKFREIARRFSVTTSSLFRHRNMCIRKKLAEARQAEILVSAASLEDQVGEIQRILRRVIVVAEAEEKPSTILTAVRELQRSIELLAKLTGKLDRAPLRSQPIPIVDEEALEHIARTFLRTTEE